MPFFMLLALLGFFAAAAYTVTTIVRLAAQYSLRKHGGGVDVGALEERLARLEASVEGIGAETQRLADGHQFFAQLLTRRPPGTLPIAKSGDPVATSGAR